MALPILAMLGKALPYVTTAWGLYAQSKNKPKKKDYLLEGGMYQRYITHLKSKTAESTAYHQRMRPALRQIGAQTQRGQRQVGYQVARDKPGGGIEAQMRMGINRQALEAIGIASEKASFAQERENVKTGEQLMRIGIREEYALQRYQADKRRFNQQMFTSVVSAGLNLANVAAKQHVADTKLKMDAAKDAAEARDLLVGQFESAKAEGLIDQGASLESYVNDVETAGYEKPKMYNKYMANIKAQGAKDVEFQKDIALEEMKVQSSDELIRFKQHVDRRPEDALDFLQESLYFKKSMTTADYKKAGEYAFKNLPKTVDPLDLEITMKSVTHNLKGLKNLLPKVVATGDIKRIEKVFTAYDAELNAAMDRVKEGDEAKMQELTIEKSKGQLQFISGMYKSTFPKYKEGKKAEGEKFFNDAMTTVRGINTKKGVALHEYNSIMKDYQNYLLTLDTDSMVGGTQVLAAIFSGDTNAINTLLNEDEAVIGINAKQVASLYLQFSGRMDAMVKGNLYEGANDVLDSLY